MSYFSIKLSEMKCSKLVHKEHKKLTQLEYDDYMLDLWAYELKVLDR